MTAPRLSSPKSLDGRSRIYADCPLLAARHRIVSAETLHEIGRDALPDPYDLLVRTTCERCVADLLYCDVHDPYSCPI